MADTTCPEVMEVEAESVAYLIGAAFGLDTIDYSLGYVTSCSGAITGWFSLPPSG
jgi:hypothetical protein